MVTPNWTGDKVLQWSIQQRPWEGCEGDEGRNLHGVLLTHTGYLIATDTKILTAVRAEFPEEWAGLVVPGTLLEAAHKQRFPGEKPTVQLDPKEEIAYARTRHGTLMQPLVEVQFPSVRNVSPPAANFPGTFPAQFGMDPLLFDRVRRALGLKSRADLRLAGPEGPIYITGEEEFPMPGFALFAPLRLTDRLHGRIQGAEEGQEVATLIRQALALPPKEK